MSDFNKDQAARRKVLTLLGTGAVALPILGLAGCGGDDSASSAPGKLAADAGDAMKDAGGAMEKAAGDAMDSASDAANSMKDKAQAAADSASDAMSDTMEAAEDAVEEVADEAATIASDAASNMPQVDENGAQASGLAYRHDATTVDTSNQPRYAAGQQCSNCVLFQGGSAEWGGCPLFVGQQVKATGWCSAYSAKS